MTRAPGPGYGRAALLGVLVTLLLTIAAGVYLVLSRYAAGAAPLEVVDNDAEAQARQLVQFSALLAILLVSTLLILLLVVGCYLVMRVGRFVRDPLAGKPTAYVDVWQKYRLTDEQIAAATQEPPPSNNNHGDADTSAGECDPDDLSPKD